MGSPNAAAQNRAFQQQYPPGTSSALATLQQQQQLRPAQPQQAKPPIQPGVIPTNPYLRADAASYRGPPPIEVYTLPDAANYSIPVEIRNLFQCDDADRVLFFTAPPGYPEDEELKPLNLAKGSSTTNDSGAGMGHSARYLAAKSRRAEELAQKRADYQREKEAQRDLERKRKRDEDAAMQGDIEKLKRRALLKLQEGLGRSTARDMKALYGKEWKGEASRTVDELEEIRELAGERRRKIEKEKEEKTAGGRITFDAFGVMLDGA